MVREAINGYYCTRCQTTYPTHASIPEECFKNTCKGITKKPTNTQDNRGKFCRHPSCTHKARTHGYCMSHYRANKRKTTLTI